MRQPGEDYFSPDDPAVEHIVRTEGVSVAVARRQLYMEAMSNQLATAADQILGSRSGGAYIDRFAVVVAATSFTPQDVQQLWEAVQRLQLRWEEIKLRQVRYSTVELMALFAQVSAFLKQTAHRRRAGYSGGIDVRANQVVVRIDETAPAGYGPQVQARFSGQPLTVTVRGVGYFT